MAKAYKSSLWTVLLLVAVCTAPSFAQHDGAKHKHYQTLKSKKLNALNFLKLTAGLGMSTYYGDICEGWDCYDFRHSSTVGVYYRYNRRLSFKADVFWTRLYNDDDIYKKHRNLGFRTDVIELAAGVNYDIFPFEHKFEKRRGVEPYVIASIGLVYFNPMGKLNNKYVSLPGYHTEGTSYSQLAPVIPFGLGFRTRLRHDMNIGAEFIYRTTFTDYLDDVHSKHYKDPKTFEGGATSDAALLSDRSGVRYMPERVRGNPGKNDGYFTFNFRIEYMLRAYTDRSGKGNLNRIPSGRKTIKRR